MKKWICMVASFILLLTGCHFPVQPQPTEAPTIPLPVPQETIVETQEPNEETTPIQYTQKPMIAVALTPVNDYLYDDLNNAIFRYTKQNMCLFCHDEGIITTITDDFQARLKSHDLVAQDYRLSANSLYSQQSDWSPHYYDVHYTTSRIDQEVLSLCGNTVSYSGGRPTQITSAINYSMLTGDVLTLGSILSHIDAKDDLVNLVVQQAASVQQQLQLFDDYENCIADRFDREESFDEDWYFTDTGLCFYFTPYEIAPYASGTVVLEIPYNQLIGVIADDFFPPEEEYMIGSIHAKLLRESDLSSYSQVPEVIIDQIGEEFFLYAEGAISDLHIIKGMWNEDGTKFTPEATVFACNSLTPGDGVILQADIPDTMPNLQIQYRSGDKTITTYLSQSGKDGSAILVP